MRTALALVAGFVALGWAGFASAQSIAFRNVSARVVIIPEERSDVQVIFVKTNPRLPLKIEKGFGNQTIVNGGDWFGLFWGAHADCDRGEGAPETIVPHVGRVAYDDLPQIVVRVPEEAVVEAGGAIYGSVGRSQSLQLHIAGCGDWTVANVAGGLDVAAAGSGRLRTGSAGRMSLSIAGASDATTTEVQNGLEVSIAGAADVHVGQASGPVEVSMAGGGSVHIDGGRATNLGVNIMGSGDVDYGGVADRLQASIAGSGDVHAAKVLGAVSRSIAGAGSVDVGP